MKYVKPLKEALSQEAIDGILDRITEVGWDGLSEMEKDILKRKDEVDDFILNFIKVVYKEPPVKDRLKLYPLTSKGQVDDEIKISLHKIMSDDHKFYMFVTNYFLEDDCPLKKIVAEFDVKNMKIRYMDIFGNNIFDKEYNENISNYVKKEDLNKFSKIFFEKSIPIINIEAVRTLNSLYRGNKKEEGGGDTLYDSDLDNSTP